MRKTLSVIIITKNEEDRIERCLKSVITIADEIIVLDSGSDDKTVSIVKKYTNKVFETDWPGYGIQKQRALDKAQCDWVLSIDADEEVDEQLAKSIKDMLADQNVVETAFKLKWGTVFLGKQLKYGRAARAPKRLFKRERAYFTDAQVHETIITEGQMRTMKHGFLKHYSNRDFNHLLTKSRMYAWFGSEKYFAKSKKSHGLLLAIFRGLWTFLQIYFFRLGLLDGKRGFLMAAVLAQYTFNKYVGLWTLEEVERLNK